MNVQSQPWLVAFVECPCINTPCYCHIARAHYLQADTLGVELSSVEGIRTGARKCNMQRNDFVSKDILARCKIGRDACGPKIWVSEFYQTTVLKPTMIHY